VLSRSFAIRGADRSRSASIVSSIAARPILEERGVLPAEVGASPIPVVHSVTAGRNELMHGIARHPDPTAA